MVGKIRIQRSFRIVDTISRLNELLLEITHNVIVVKVGLSINNNALYFLSGRQKPTIFAITFVASM